MPDTRRWYFYLVRCSDGSLYAGITLDPEKRTKQHNAGKGAKYTAQRRPVILTYYEECTNKSIARKRELQVKAWRSEKKEWLIRGFPSTSLSTSSG
jgi:putative endonuclease